MYNGAICFVDSGLGGLTCIPNLFSQIPNEHVIYFGDTARTPYGSKAVSTIKHYANQIADFLYTKDVKMMVIACNTITATCLYDLQKRFPDIPIVGIINPAAGKIARTCDENNRIGVIATKVTIASDDYNREIKKLNPNLHVFSKAAPAFVPLIEEGIIDNEIMDLTIKYYLDDFLSENKIDTLVLGCTHYPLLIEKIKAFLPEGITLFSQGEYVAASLTDYLRRHPEMDIRLTKQGNCRFLTTESAAKFSDAASVFLNHPVEVEKIRLVE